MSSIYLDYNATTPPLPAVLEAMARAAATAWANPASVHRPGQRARAELDRAREAVAALVGRSAHDVVLTSGGTEANHLALWSRFAAGPGGAGLLVSRLEHPSVVRAAEALASRGLVVGWVEVASDGRATAAAFRAEAERLRAAGVTVRLVALQAVNHETGVVQPVGEVAELARTVGAELHVDAVQAVGRLTPEVWAGADTVAVASHKLGGPKGIGALASRPGVHLSPLLGGGGQERGIRPGTHDPVAAAGFAVAAAHAIAGPARHAALAPLRDRLEAELVALAAELGAGAAVNGRGARAPHVTSLSFAGWSGPELCAALDLEGVAVSSGAACSAGTAEPSPVITAMLGGERAAGAVRISLGAATRGEETARALAAFRVVLARRSSARA